jgi:mannose-6-phosphate isomerase-like protein (cupin superfamily)
MLACTGTGARKEVFLAFRIIKPGTIAPVPIDGRPERGTTIPLVNAELGTDNVDVHINVLRPKGPNGREHRHSRADNVYIVKSGEGLLTVEGEPHRIVADDVVFLPAGVHHSLSNVSDRELVIYEIYAPSGSAFDFLVRE